MQALTKPPSPFSAVWRSMVANGIRDGWGVEDLALRLACGPSVIRREVRALRDQGLLASGEWWGRA